MDHKWVFIGPEMLLDRAKHPKGLWVCENCEASTAPPLDKSDDYGRECKLVNK